MLDEIKDKISDNVLNQLKRELQLKCYVIAMFALNRLGTRHFSFTDKFERITLPTKFQYNKQFHQ